MLRQKKRPGDILYADEYNIDNKLPRYYFVHNVSNVTLDYPDVPEYLIADVTLDNPIWPMYYTQLYVSGQATITNTGTVNLEYPEFVVETTQYYVDGSSEIHYGAFTHARLPPGGSVTAMLSGVDLISLNGILTRYVMKLKVFTYQSGPVRYRIDVHNMEIIWQV